VRGGAHAAVRAVLPERERDGGGLILFTITKILYDEFTNSYAL